MAKLVREKQNGVPKSASYLSFGGNEVMGHDETGWRRA
jgi:hypothetical protein